MARVWRSSPTRRHCSSHGTESSGRSFCSKRRAPGCSMPSPQSTQHRRTWRIGARMGEAVVGHVALPGETAVTAEGSEAGAATAACGAWPCSLSQRIRPRARAPARNFLPRCGRCSGWHPCRRVPRSRQKSAGTRSVTAGSSTVGAGVATCSHARRADRT